MLISTEVPSKPKIDLSYTAPLSLMETCSTPRDICPSLLIATLLPTVKIWSPPRYPSTDKWIKEEGHMYTMEFYSVLKRNKVCRKWSHLQENGWRLRSL